MKPTYIQFHRNGRNEYVTSWVEKHTVAVRKVTDEDRRHPAYLDFRKEREMSDDKPADVGDIAEAMAGFRAGVGQVVTVVKAELAKATAELNDVGGIATDAVKNVRADIKKVRDMFGGSNHPPANAGNEEAPAKKTGLFR